MGVSKAEGAQVTFLDQMREFDEKRGKDPINPLVIAGGPPPGSTDARVQPQEVYDPPSAKEIYGPPIEHEVQSPLVALGKGELPISRPTPEQAQELMAGTPIMNQLPPDLPELIVLGTNATLSGHAVILSVVEEAAVKRVVIGAVERKMKQERDALLNLLPRRGRKPKVPRGTTVGFPVSTPITQTLKEAPKRRGRPRKVKESG
jgi:hypothetical protein